jgi:hypothetical protein
MVKKQKGNVMNNFKPIATLVLLFLFAIANFKCLKEELDGSSTPIAETVTETRSGFTDVIFYRTSLTTDNFLLTNTSGVFRTYNIFNKTKIENIVFKESGQNNINVNGVLLKHYKIQINFKDSTNYEFAAFSKLGANTFTFVPNGENQLSDQHSAKFIEIKYTGRNQLNGYNFWRDNTPNTYLWEIRKDSTNLVATKLLDPIDRTSNIFSPKHQH